MLVFVYAVQIATWVFTFIGALHVRETAGPLFRVIMTVVIALFALATPIALLGVYVTVNEGEEPLIRPIEETWITMDEME